VPVPELVLLPRAAFDPVEPDEPPCEPLSPLDPLELLDPLIPLRDPVLADDDESLPECDPEFEPEPERDPLPELPDPLIPPDPPDDPDEPCLFLSFAIRPPALTGVLITSQRSLRSNASAALRKKQTPRQFTLTRTRESHERIARENRP
jgi:hypothetical protein